MKSQFGTHSRRRGVPFGASAALTYKGNPSEASRRDSRVDPLGVACSPSQVTLFLPVHLRRDAQFTHVCVDVGKAKSGAGLTFGERTQVAGRLTYGEESSWRPPRPLLNTPARSILSSGLVGGERHLMTPAVCLKVGIRLHLRKRKNRRKGSIRAGPHPLGVARSTGGGLGGGAYRD